MAKRSRRKKNDQKQLIIGVVILVVLVVFFAIVNSIGQEELFNNLPMEISAAEAYSYLENGAFILDVRTQKEWDEGHIPGATLIPLAELPDRLDEVPQGMDIVVVCRTGTRSSEGRDLLLSSGFTAVTSIDGGITEWQAAGYPFE